MTNGAQSLLGLALVFVAAVFGADIAAAKTELKHVTLSSAGASKAGVGPHAATRIPWSFDAVGAVELPFSYTPVAFQSSLGLPREPYFAFGLLRTVPYFPETNRLLFEVRNSRDQVATAFGARTCLPGATMPREGG